MKLHVLVDNIAGTKYKAEHGLSFVIENENEGVLFDAGASDLFAKNARLLKIDLERIKKAVLSHGHWDHGKGFKYVHTKTIISHPDVFVKRYRKSDNSPVGIPNMQKHIAENNTWLPSKCMLKLIPDVYYMGEIPRSNNFESRQTAFVFENGADDFIPDDTALFFDGVDGLVIISACAHAGICNTIEYAKLLSGKSKVQAVIGGFHLKTIDVQTEKTLSYLQNENIPVIAPSHCTSFKVRSYFASQLNEITEVKSGDLFEFQ